jgi:hypothetical protein
MQSVHLACATSRRRSSALLNVRITANVFLEYLGTWFSKKRSYKVCHKVGVDYDFILCSHRWSACIAYTLIPRGEDNTHRIHRGRFYPSFRLVKRNLIVMDGIIAMSDHIGDKMIIRYSSSMSH